MASKKPEILTPHPTWRVVAYTTVEGGDWHYDSKPPESAAAIRYYNGWIFDRVLFKLGENPWRHWRNWNG